MSGYLVLTEKATLLCDHAGKLENKPSQKVLTIDGDLVLVAKDPENRKIHFCPNTTPFNEGLRPFAGRRGRLLDLRFGQRRRRLSGQHQGPHRRNAAGALLLYRPRSG